MLDRAMLECWLKDMRSYGHGGWAPSPDAFEQLVRLGIKSLSAPAAAPGEGEPQRPTEERGVEHCPHCPDQGFIVKANRNAGEPEQEQCEWCHTTPNSAFLASEGKDHG